MSRSGSSDDRSGGRRRRGRGPRWVTDRAREIADRAPPPPARRWQPPAPWTPPERRPDHRPQQRYPWDDERNARDGNDHRPPPPARGYGREYDDGDTDELDLRPAKSRLPRDGDDRGDGSEPSQPRPNPWPRPRKITVTRVAAWRSRELTRQGIAAFRRAATADGADRSGLTALTYATMASFGVDAAVAVGLANTLFFSAATAESKTKVALYLLVTVAPFALVAPVIGPLLDRLQHGRRVALAASFVGRGVLAVVMAQHFDDWLLYPAALGALVLSRSYGVLKAAVVPRVAPPDLTLTKINSRLTLFALGAGAAIGAVAAGFVPLFGSAGALWFTAVVCLGGALLCLRIPAWVEVTEGEVPASLRDHGGEEADGARRRREPLGRHAVVALWGTGTIRILTGFLTLFVAFVVKAQTEHSPWMQLVLVGTVAAAAGAGNIAGNALGTHQRFARPDPVILSCVFVVLFAAVLAALIPGIATAVLVGLVGSTCSSLAKICLDAVIQRDMSEESRASAFGRAETILQLAWTFGGAIGVLLPPVYWLGFTVVSALLGFGALQTYLTHRGRTLIPRFGGNRPARTGGPGGAGRAVGPARAPRRWRRR